MTPEPDVDVARMQGDLVRIFRAPGRAIDDEEFDLLARRSFAHQFGANEVYRRFCESRGKKPGTVGEWQEIPCVPATAFKHFDLYSGGGEPAAVFETSGTSRGRSARGRHPIMSMALYREAATAWFGAHLVPDAVRLPVICLVPDPDSLPSSSLSAMMGFAIDAFGAEGSGFFAHPETGVDSPALRAALEAAVTEGMPVLVMGTAFAWVHWIEQCRAWNVSFRLPEGSRLMETGGFKGLSREVPRTELYAELEETLGIPQPRMVNEYGMTELLSQLYEPVLTEPVVDLSARTHRAPPWLRVRALDPETLEPVPDGKRGLLAFFDLANLGSVSAILTEDVGVVGESGLRLLGRASGAEARGCSLAMEELLEEAR